MKFAIGRVLLLCGAFHMFSNSGVLANTNVIPTSYSNMTCHLASGKEGICVYAYLCQNDVINTDGTAIIDLRFSDDCEDYFLKCCSKESPCNENKGKCVAKNQCGADLNAKKYTDFKESEECDWSGYHCCPNEKIDQTNSGDDNGDASDNDKTVNADECDENAICVPDDQCMVNPDGVNLLEPRVSVCSGSETCCPRNKIKSKSSNACEEIGGTCVKEGQCNSQFAINLRTEICTVPGFECCMENVQASTSKTPSHEGKPCFNNLGTCSQKTDCVGTVYKDRKNDCDGLTCCGSPRITTATLPTITTPDTSYRGLPCVDNSGICIPRKECKGTVYKDKNKQCGSLVCCASSNPTAITEPTDYDQPDDTCESLRGTCEEAHSCLQKASQSPLDCEHNTVCCLSKQEPGTDPGSEPGSEPGPEPEPAIKDCGYRNEDGIKFDTVNRNDGESQYGEFPWMVAIMSNELGSAKLSCGGTLIDPEVVITTAECVKSFKRTPEKLIIRAGEWDMAATMEPIPHQERGVLKIISHPDFKPNTLVNNVALLFLDDKFDLTSTINTVCLPPQDFNIHNGEVIATGWGTTPQNRTKYQQILKSIDLPYTQKSDCERTLRRATSNRKFKLHSSFICAGGEVGKDTCKGDAGSPVVYLIPDDSDYRYYAVGMVSWGIGCGRAGTPAVYTDIGKFRNWIDKEIEEQGLQMHYYEYQPANADE